MANLKSMSVTQLLALRDDVAKYLSAKKDELENLMRQLSGADKTGGPQQRRKGSGKVAAKYRHPTTGETWSGRGATVKWLAKELEAGKKKEDFLIANASKKSTIKKSTKKKTKK